MYVLKTQNGFKALHLIKQSSLIRINSWVQYSISRYTNLSIHRTSTYCMAAFIRTEELPAVMWNKLQKPPKFKPLKYTVALILITLSNYFHYYVIYLTPSKLLYIQYEQIMNFMAIWMYINNSASIRVFCNAKIFHNYCMFLEMKVSIKNSPDIYTVTIFKCNTVTSL